MSHDIWSRLRFLLYLVAEYNDSHKDTQATFRLDKLFVEIYVAKGDTQDRIATLTPISCLTEDKTYEIYKALKKETDTIECP